MALISAVSNVSPQREGVSVWFLIAAGRRWAEAQGFPRELIDDETAIECGFIIEFSGEHQPDLVLALANRFSVPHTVKMLEKTKGGFTQRTRHVVLNPEPEPEPVPALTEPVRKRREYDKARAVRKTLRLSEQENADLAEAAQKAGKTPSEFIRDALFREQNADRAWRGEKVDLEFIREAERKVEAIQRRGKTLFRRPQAAKTTRRI